MPFGKENFVEGETLWHVEVLGQRVRKPPPVRISRCLA
jgi:hypothetical protein